MLISTANIYVSVGQPLRRDSDESDGSRYRREKHTYLISVEPHRFHIPGLPHHETTVTHFEAINNISSGSPVIVRYSSKTSPSIIGNILIAKSAQATTNKVYKILSESLASSAGSDDSYGDDEDEHRIKLFLHALLDHGMIAKFSLDEFMTWTHSYVMDRLNNEAPSLIAYPRAHKDYGEQQQRRHKSWTVDPVQRRPRTDSKTFR